MRRTSPDFSTPRGFSLAEVLIVVALIGVLATLSLNLLRKQNHSSKWGRLAGDYVQNLVSAYAVSRSQYGAGPLAAQKCNSTTTCTLQNAYDDGSSLKGIGEMLRNWESGVTYSAGPPKTLSYGSGILVYVQPDDSNVPDTGGEIVNGTVTYAGATNDLAGANGSDWSFLLLDMNGTLAPNTAKTGGDRVLLYLDDSSGRVYTAWQFCQEKGGTVTVPNSTCVVSGKTFYKSFYDTYKGY